MVDEFKKSKRKKKLIFILIGTVLLISVIAFLFISNSSIISEYLSSNNIHGIKDYSKESKYRSQKSEKINLLDLKILKQEGFEKYLNYSIKKINQSSWEVSYNLDSKVLKDINDCNKLEGIAKNQCIDNISEKYSEKEVADNISVKNSILNIENYPVNSTYQNILVDNKKINLSKNGKFIITIEGFDSSNVEKYNHNKIKVGFNTTEFEIIIYVSNAQHLDEDRVFISDITDSVKYKDGIWSEEIKSDEYARITFEHKINSSRDITLYAKGTNAIIDVYEKDRTTILAEYPIINSEGFYKIYLTNLTGEQDTFDLKTQSGKIEYDWIVDPSGDINISFITPAVSSFTTNNTNVTINISIVTDILSKFIFNWNGTNLTIYDNASRLILGFNNLSSLGENDSVAVDVGYQKVNATFNNSVTWISDGKYGGAYNFTGLAGSYMSLGNTFAVVSPYQYSYCLWFRPASFSVPNQTLIGRFSATGTRTDYAMIVVNGSQIAFSKDNSVDLTDILSIWNVPNMNVGSWHHFCIVAYNQSTVGAYFDGLSYGNKTTEYIDQGSAGLYIGNGLVSRFATNGETTLSNFNGTIDEVRFINKSLSSDEVQNMYIRNFFEYNTTRWYFYINQSKNVTAGLDNGTYSYQAFGYDLTNILNYTELRNVTINTSYTGEIPAITPQINFTYPTPPNETSTTNTSFIVNISISSSTLNSTIFNWNGTNFTIYNNSLVAMYNFENFSTLQENSTKATDLSLAGNNATLHATTLISNGKFGNALSFTDSSSSYLDTQIDSSGTNAVTISMWINRTWGLGARVLFESSSNFNLVDTGFGVFPDNSADCSTSYPTYVATKGDVSFNTRCYAQPSSGVWHNLVFVFDRSQNGANEIKYYIDGVLQTAGIAPATNDNNNNFGNNALYLMSRAGSSLYSNGSIDEFRFWNRALTASEINELYMINLQKFNSTQWYLYVNQTKNSTNGLDFGTYSYQGFITDASGNFNQTESRTITITSGVSDTTYPQFSNYYDNNASLLNSGIGLFNVTLLNTNGTVWLDINGNNYTATNVSGSATVFNATYTFTSGGTYSYRWWAYGNGSSTNKNKSDERNYTVNSSDLVYPQFSNLESNNDTLEVSGLGTFGVTITNTNGTAWLEINGVNISATNSSSTIFNATHSFTTNGTYTYRWWAYGNGTTHLINKSSDSSYFVKPDTTPPTLTLTNKKITILSALKYQILATDISGIGCFTVNDTTFFNINCSGYLTNNTIFDSVKIYYINITVNDTLGNLASGVMYVNVTAGATGGGAGTCRYKKFGYWNDALPFFKESGCT